MEYSLLYPQYHTFNRALQRTRHEHGAPPFNGRLVFRYGEHLTPGRIVEVPRIIAIASTEEGSKDLSDSKS